jgi:chromosome segregation ATPase
VPSRIFGGPPMADEPLTLSALTRFHREVIASDFQKVLERLDRVDSRLGEVHGQVSGLDALFDRRDSEYGVLVAGLRDVEDRLNLLQGRIDGFAVRSELELLREKVTALQEQIRSLQERLED